MQEKNWHSLSVADCFKRLKSSAKGLDSEKAKNLQKKIGKNQLPAEKSLSSLAILLSQIKSPLVYVLIAAGLISVFLNHATDALVIFLVVIVNTFFGFWQENKASKAVTYLKKIVKQEAKVMRNGREIKIDASELVPGDVIFLRAGNKVPADARLIDTEDLQAMEATLTGESTPSRKNIKRLQPGTSLADRENMVYMGTLIVRGIGRAVVCATGVKTEIGKITKMIREAKEEKTPLQIQLYKFSQWLTAFIVLLCLILFGLGLSFGKDPLEMFLIVVALAVAAIPEGLLVAVTIILTIGMQRLLKKKALIRKLIAAETLGSISIICTDKTGTLTEGKMQVAKIITVDKEYSVSVGIEMTQMEKVQSLISKVSVLCSSAAIENPNEDLKNLRIIGDPTEKALLLAAIQSGFDKDQLDAEYIKQYELPFDSEKKYMATLHYHKTDRHSHVFVKGAPEKVLAFSSRVLMGDEKKKLTDAQLKHINKKYEALTKGGLRVLALAYKTANQFGKLENELNDLVFLGFIALKDPLRSEAKEAISLCRQAGIRPIIITGDHPLTAKAVAQELGFKINSNVVEGRELDDWSDEQLRKKIKYIDIYARVEPRHKMRVVDAWQSKNEVVAMTGDGINDAPALKSADTGIALGDGSDVTKETADIILLDNNFKVIVTAVEQGRIIFDNIRKVILYLLTDSFSEIILISGAILMNLPLPVLASQILWINLVADGLPNIAMTLEPGEKKVMGDKPRPKGESIINREMKILIFVIGIIVDIILLAWFILLLAEFDDLNYIRTIIFAALGFDSLLYVFSVRTLRHSIFNHNPLTNKYLLASVGLGFLLLLSAIYLPFADDVFKTVRLGIDEWCLIIGLAIVKVILIEIVKHYFIVKNKNTRLIQLKNA